MRVPPSWRPGPTVLEMFNTLLRQLRLSIDYALTGSYDGAVSLGTKIIKEHEERMFQEAVIKTIGEETWGGLGGDTETWGRAQKWDGQRSGGGAKGEAPMNQGLAWGPRRWWVRLEKGPNSGGGTNPVTLGEGRGSGKGPKVGGVW